MDSKVCKNHPQVVSRIRCFECKEYICAQCRLHLDHHYFCSKRCHRVNWGKSIFKKLRKHKVDLILGWNVLASFALFFFLIYFFAKTTTPSTNNHTVQTPLAVASPDTFFQASVPIDTLPVFAREITNTILGNSAYELALQLERGWTVTVWCNDWPVFSEVVLADEEKKYNIPLSYGDNRIRVGIWNEKQQLVFQDEQSVAFRTPRIESLRQPVTRGSSKEKRIALTFDGGSSNKGVDSVLAILRRKKMVSTMFITGQFIERYPELVNQMIADGHEIGNHTYNHPHMTSFGQDKRHVLLEGVDRSFVHHQLMKTDSLFRVAAGRAFVPYWRAAYGEYNRKILDWAAEVGYKHIGWTRGCDTFDWVSDPAAELYRTPEKVRELLLAKDNENRDLNGAIVLMHLATERKELPFYTILPDLIDDLHSRGFETVTVSQLLAE